jgi:hypothetical protein
MKWFDGLARTEFNGGMARKIFAAAAGEERSGVGGAGFF